MVSLSEFTTRDTMGSCMKIISVAEIEHFGLRGIGHLSASKPVDDSLNTVALIDLFRIYFNLLNYHKYHIASLPYISPIDIFVWKRISSDLR